MSFKEVHSKYLNIINTHLDAFLNSQIREVATREPSIKNYYSMLKDYTMMGGKRLRPIGVILSYLSSGGKEEKRIFLPAVAVELHQSYSLILDDIMDEDDYRRGSPGINKKLREYYLRNFKEETYDGSLFNKKSSKFTVSFALMLGNMSNVLSKKAVLMCDFPDEVKIKALKVIETADMDIYHGQMMDIMLENKRNISEGEYMEMIRLKTSAFFGMAFELGALFAGSDENKRLLFRELGINSALGFQIEDDILDLTSGKGHEIGSDIRKGKKTLLMIKTFEKLPDKDKKILMNVFGKENASERDIRGAIEIIHKSGAIEYSRKVAMKKSNEAKDILKKLKLDGYYGNLFSEFADFMVKRKI